MAGTIIPGGLVYPTAPTPAQSENSTRVATTAFTKTFADFKADISSPTLTGTPTAPTANITARDNQVATTAFVVAAVNAAVPLPTQPTVVAPSQVYGNSTSNFIRPSGSTSVVGGTLTYSIQNISAPGLTFSKTTGIAENEQVNFTVPNVPTNATVTFDVVAVVGVRQSIPRTVTMNIIALPTAYGQAWQGGYYFGQIQVGSDTYLLVVAPKASGQTTGLVLKTSSTITASTNTLNDGWTNSNAMNNASHPAVQFCRGLTIGGYTDWYMPARDELEMFYRNLKPYAGNNITGYKAPSDPDSVSYGFMGVNPFSIPNGTEYTTVNPAQTGATPFRAGGTEAMPVDGSYMWASTQNTGPSATGTKAWVQVFGGANSGLQNLVSKTDSLAITRAIRRVKVN